MIDFLISITESLGYRITIILVITISLLLSFLPRFNKYQDNIHVMSYQRAVSILVFFDLTMWFIKSTT